MDIVVLGYNDSGRQYIVELKQVGSNGVAIRTVRERLAWWGGRLRKEKIFFNQGWSHSNFDTNYFLVNGNPMV